MKRCVLAIAGLLLLGVVGALSFAWSGIYNVAASVPHWPPTRWFFTFGLRHSVETQALGIAVPALDAPWQVAAGLGHYEGACQPCHGAPGRARNPLVRGMLPEPPYLPEHVHEWTPAQLFWVVKNGLKYTGMPAWPAPSRDDEVWAVVAALLLFPHLDGPGYVRLLQGGAAQPIAAADSARLIATAGPAGEAVVACARCHGLDGAGGGAGAFPRLAGQSEAYLLDSLRAFALGGRQSGFMQPVAGALDENQMRKLAAYFAGRRAVPPAPPPADPARLARGQAIAMAGLPAKGVPACVTCHGDEARRRNPLFPNVDGQFAPYLAQQLRLFAGGGRGGTRLAMLMEAAVKGLDEGEIQAAAHYYAAGAPP